MLIRSIRFLFVRFLFVIVVTAILSACATAPTATIMESSGKLTLAQSHIGEPYDQVIKRAASAYKVEPQCEGRKVGLKNSRKAFLYDVCGFNPEGVLIADAPLSEVVYHFIDQQLVRVDVRAQGESVLLDQVKSDMQSVFASRDATSSELRANSYEWIATQHLAGVRAGGGASEGNIHIRLLDQSLTDSAPWLAEE